MAELENEQLDTAVVGEEIVEAPAETVVIDRPRKVYSGMWGVPEIAAASVAGLTVLLSFVIYFFWVVPADRELARNKDQAAKLETDLTSANSKFGQITDSETQVGKVLSSVDDFEMRYLPVVSTGQTALYQRLNSLMSAYGLVNTSGPDYVPLETLGSGNDQSQDQKGRERFKSIYPGVYVTATIEGTYQNLRRFIRDIETGNDFVIVSAVELAPSDTQKEKDKDENKSGQPQGPVMQPGVRTMQGGLPSAAMPVTGPNGFGGTTTIRTQPQQSVPKAKLEGKAHGEYVSLHIELAAYFRRPVTNVSQ